MPSIKDFHAIYQAKRWETMLRRYRQVVRRYRRIQPDAVRAMRRDFRATSEAIRLRNISH